MYILAIDSTSFNARMSLTHNLECKKEITLPSHSDKWMKMLDGDTSYLVDDFLNILETFFKETKVTIETIDAICYSGSSGFQVSMNVGKILATVLGGIYKKEVICVDHITAHYFSLFVNREKNDTSYPILFFSASGSHNSLAILKNIKDLTILNDATYYDETSKKHIGLGSIYYNLCLLCNIIKPGDSAENIGEKISSLSKKIDNDLVEIFMNYHNEESIFGTNFYPMFRMLQKSHQELSIKYNTSELFFSFEEAIHQLIIQKFDAIIKLIPIRHISIVGGISQNNDFFKKVEDIYKKRSIQVSRPLEGFRFDNASMLGILAYHMKTHDVSYPFSKIVT